MRPSSPTPRLAFALMTPRRFRDRARPRTAWRPLWLVVFGALALLISPVGAQDDVATLETLKAERQRIQAEAAAQAAKVNASQASFDELIVALDAVNSLVDLQEARLSEAQQALASAQKQVALAEAREEEISTEIAEIQTGLVDLALASFTGETGENGHGLTAMLLSADPSEAARRRSLVEFQTGSLTDGIDRMRALSAEAADVSANLRSSAAAAEAGKVEADVRVAELEAAKEQQMTLVLAADARLESRLAEAAELAQLDAAKAAEITRQEEAIAKRIRRETLAAAAAAAAGNRPRPPAPENIATVQGIRVHERIAGTLDSMLSAARADGINLGGWGYRDSVKQVELRMKHCGTSEYQIWDMPASLCSPPTARPGRSKHEQGLAVDFTYNGGSMTSHSNPGFRWLAAHAASYGFVNLPSEPWHWSHS
ncbi:MAG: hypothetical protein EX269_05775 [Acidimicrobiales bacterium]|nr:MAG: hypothetical protein EX269_05775 [Acidimicrobiales bacterium]